jgi:hypothetical protein
MSCLRSLGSRLESANLFVHLEGLAVVAGALALLAVLITNDSWQRKNIFDECLLQDGTYRFRQPFVVDL